MRPVRVAVTGVAASAPIPMDFRAQNFNVGIQVLVTGTATYSVQYTLDDIYAPSPTWTDLPAPFTAATATAVGNSTVPCSGMRLNVTAGTGRVALSLIQTSGQG